MLNSLARLTAGGLRCERHLCDEEEREIQLQYQADSRKPILPPESVQQLLAADTLFRPAKVPAPSGPSENGTPEARTPRPT